MARIGRDVVDAVRDRTDIVEVVSRHLKLTRRGSSFVGLCPFHQEKTPSFNVIPAKGIFHCFGCQTGGDVFKFLMLLEGLSFVEAIKELAGPAGVTIEERELTREQRAAFRQRATLYDVLEAAAAHFTSALWTRPEGQVARDYLRQRGMTRETANTARLGYAPPGWSRLLDHLHHRGFPVQQIASAGLARQRQSGTGYYDAFRDRIVFPICDERGRVIAFGGRVLEGDAPKYINTPETTLYHKSKTLYGLDMARAGIQRRDRVLIVEGYFDVLSLHQAGYTETIATCGTALTSEHLRQIRRMTRNVVLLMDADAAGLRAAERALPLMIEAGIQPWRLEIEGSKDPDDLVREQGPEAVEAALQHRQSLLDWFIDRKLAEYGSGVPGALSRERVLEDVVPLLAQIDDTALVDRVARRLNTSTDKLYRRMRQPRDASRPPEPAPAATAAPGTWRPHRDVVHVLWLLVHRRSQVQDLMRPEDIDLLVGHDPVHATARRLLAGDTIGAILADLTDDNIRRTLSSVVARDKLYEPHQAAKGMCDVLQALSRPRRTARLNALVNDIEAAGRKGDVAALSQATARRAALVRTERELEAAIDAGNHERAMALLRTRGQVDGDVDPT